MISKNQRPAILSLAACACLLLAAPQARAELLAFNSFESDPNELPFVTSLVAPDPVPTSGPVWWIYPNAETPSAGQSNAAIFASDTFNDYFTVTYPGILDLVSAANPDTTGRDGIAELTAEHVVQDGISTGTASITFDPVSVNGYNNVVVRVLLAAAEDPDFENSDFLTVEAVVPGGSTYLLGDYRGDGSGRLALDTDQNGTGDGPPLGHAYSDEVLPVPTGLIEFQLRFSTNVDGDEEIFIDNIRIEGDPGGVVRDPIMLVETIELDFGTIPEGGTKDLTVTVSNHPTATQNLTILDTSGFSGSDSGVFSIVDALPLNVAPGASTDLTIRATGPDPGGLIIEDALLTIQSNDNVFPTREISLQGIVPTSGIATVEVSGVDNPPTTFATVGEAKLWLDANAPGQEWVINITTDGPQIEPVIVELTTYAFGGVTIKGDADGNGVSYTWVTDASVPGSQANYASAQGSYGAIALEAGSATYLLQDLIFMPKFIAPNSIMDDSVGGSSGVRVLTVDDYANGPATQKEVILRNIVIGGSKEGDVLAADPNVNEFAECTRYSRGINIFSTPTQEDAPMSTLLVEDVRIYNIELESFNHSGDYMHATFGPGCVFAWSGETCLLANDNNNGTLAIQGSPEKRILIRGSGLIDEDEEGMQITPTENTEWTIMSYVDVVENGAETEMGTHQGPLVMEHCRIALNDLTNDDADGTDTGLRYGYPADPLVTTNTNRIIRNTTLYDTQSPAGEQRGLNLYGRMDGYTFDVTDVIIAGAGDIGIDTRDGGDSVLNVSFSALVTEGPDALASVLGGTSGGSPNFTINQSNVVSADPQFASTTYVYGDSDDFLRPTNPLYATAASDGGFLLGGAVAVVPSEGSDVWSIH